MIQAAMVVLGLSAFVLGGLVGAWIRGAFKRGGVVTKSHDAVAEVLAIKERLFPDGADVDTRSEVEFVPSHILKAQRLTITLLVRAIESLVAGGLSFGKEKP